MRCFAHKKHHPQLLLADLADHDAGRRRTPRLAHGKVSTYSNHQCRCDACKAAKSIANRNRYL